MQHNNIRAYYNSTACLYQKKVSANSIEKVNKKMPNKNLNRYFVGHLNIFSDAAVIFVGEAEGHQQ